MKKYFYFYLTLYFISFTASASDIKSLVLFYDEVEEGTEPQIMRYIINKQFLRIDNGDDEGDFVLFDVKKKAIYSINQEDKTILKIKNHQWVRPELSFQVVTKQKAMQNAPKIANKQVYSYIVFAGDIACTQVSLVKGLYAENMQVLYEYQQVLSGQQVATLKNTPIELHTPCFLVDQIYDSGDYYKAGLPVQISYSRGYQKFLKDFKESSFDIKLFVKPQGYSEYTAALNK